MLMYASTDGQNRSRSIVGSYWPEDGRRAKERVEEADARLRAARTFGVGEGDEVLAAACNAIGYGCES